MNRTQKIIAAFGLVALAFVFTYVPFDSTYEYRDAHHKAYEGYYFIWAPPDPITVCEETFGRNAPYGEPRIRWANERCYASPVFSRVIASASAIIVLILAIHLLTGALRREPKSLQSLNKDKEQHYDRDLEVEAYSLTNMLRSDLGVDFPVSKGSATRDDPLIITELSDYVAIEFAVVKYMLSKIRKECKLRNQSLLNQNGRMIDELVFDIRPIGEEAWSGRRHFYFDITDGFSKPNR